MQNMLMRLDMFQAIIDDILSLGGYDTLSCPAWRAFINSHIYDMVIVAWKIVSM